MTHAPANPRAVWKVLKSGVIPSEGDLPAIGEMELSGFDLEPRSRGEEQDNIQRKINGVRRGRVVIPEDNKSNLFPQAIGIQFKAGRKKKCPSNFLPLHKPISRKRDG